MACRMRLKANEALVQVISSDGPARNWVPFGKFTLPLRQDKEKFDVGRFIDQLTEGVLARLVRCRWPRGRAGRKES